MKTAILDLAKHVTILEFNFEYTHALVMDEDGGEFEVSLDRLDGIEDKTKEDAEYAWLQEEREIVWLREE